VKLLIYSHYFAPSIGGVETIVGSLAGGLAECRTAAGAPEFEVTLITRTPVGDFEDRTMPFPVVRQPRFWQLFRRVRGTEVLHVAGPALLPILLGMIARKPVVVEHHGFQTICPNGQLVQEPSRSPCPGHFMAGRHAECWRCNASQGILTSLKLWLLTFVRRFLSGRVAANIAPTQWLSRQLNLPRATCIPHGLEPFRAGPPGKSTNPIPVIAFQGRLVTTKGIGVLLEAARILQEHSVDFTLRIIGDGPERDSLERLAEEKRISPRVQFLGGLPPPKLEEELGQADVVVVPSLGGEVFGLVIAENMLRGLPVVASDLGAFVEVIGDAGITFRTADASDLAHRLAELLSDSAVRADMIVRARKRGFSFFSRARMIEAHANVYRRLHLAANP
jgi:glycogen synthase